MLFLIFLFRLCLVVTDADRNFIETDSSSVLKNQLKEMNEELMKMNRETAELGWEISTGSGEDVSRKSVQFGEFRTKWRNNWCSKLTETFENIYKINYVDTNLQPKWIFRKNYDKEFRQFYLLCRGPKYTLHQAR